MDNLQDEAEVLEEVEPIAERLHLSPQGFLSLVFAAIIIFVIFTTVMLRIMHVRYHREQRRRNPPLKDWSCDLERHRSIASFAFTLPEKGEVQELERVQIPPKKLQRTKTFISQFEALPLSSQVPHPYKVLDMPINQPIEQTGARS